MIKRLQLEDAEAAATEDGGAVCAAEAGRAFHAPAACPCCDSAKLLKLGEDVTETLEVIPKPWKIIQTVRERYSCRDCETISQPPAPFHAIPRRLAGLSLLTIVLFEKFGQHRPLNWRSERCAREGIQLSLSTPAITSALAWRHWLLCTL